MQTATAPPWTADAVVQVISCHPGVVPPHVQCPKNMSLAQLCLQGTSALNTACQIRGLQGVSYDPTPAHVGC